MVQQREGFFWLLQKNKLPIIALGLGEKEDDLQIFEAEKFADAFTQIN